MARSDGYNTRTRQQILQYLIDSRAHAVSAASILAHLEEEGLSASATTVYRYLERLSAEGRVMKYVADKGEKAVFQYVGEGAHCKEHLHLKCTQCGQIYHLDCGFMDEVRAHLEAQHGFALQCEGSILYGLCSRCRARAGKTPKVPFPVDSEKKP
jgi:Fur family ferric uptake transcriptional regulator